jgi:hypothetical protein
VGAHARHSGAGHVGAVDLDAHRRIRDRSEVVRLRRVPGGQARRCEVVVPGVEARLRDARVQQAAQAGSAVAREVEEGAGCGRADRHVIGVSGQTVGPEGGDHVGALLGEHRGDAGREQAESWNDPERLIRLRDERDALVHEITAAFGLGGRPRRLGSEAERARLNVTRAIRTAIRNIAAQAPELGAHLDATVRTGTRCRYDPPD